MEERRFSAASDPAPAARASARWTTGPKGRALVTLQYAALKRRPSTALPMFHVAEDREAPGCQQSQSVSQLKVLLESGVVNGELAPKLRKNPAHGASRGWKVEDDRAPEERKKSCNTASLAVPTEGKKGSGFSR